MPLRRALVAGLVASLIGLAACGGPGVPAPRPAAPAITAPARAGVAYASASPAESLDLWLPDGGPRRAPLVIFFHGGGFAGGDKRDVGAKVTPLLRAGFAVASVNYRLSGQARFPAAASDAKAAVRYLRAHASTFGLDPDRFAAWGESAGANLAVLLGTTGDRPTVFDDPRLGSAGTPSDVRAVVDWYGPVDFAQRERQFRAPGSGCRTPQFAEADRFVTDYLGADVDAVPQRAAAASPITYLRAGARLPRFSIAHGTADCLVPLGQAEILAGALRAVGQAPDLRILDGAAHADPRFDRELLEPTIRWLTGTLGSG